MKKWLIAVIGFILITLTTCQSDGNYTAPPQPQGNIFVYLDIETTGFSHSKNDITVIGIYLEEGAKSEFIQLVGDEITAPTLTEIFTTRNIKTLYTYNGIQFDLAFIRYKLDIDLTKYTPHIDLMNVCHKKNLYGGLKKVEKELGISRDSDIDGKTAVELWRKYKNEGDIEALKTLLKYNKEDAINLSLLKRALDQYK